MGVASWQHHLIEVREAQVPIFVVTVELYQEEQVFRLELLTKVVGAVFADEGVEVFVVDAEL